MCQDTIVSGNDHAVEIDRALVKHEPAGALGGASAMAGRAELCRRRASRSAGVMAGHSGLRLPAGVAFSSYAVPAIRRAVWRAVTEAPPPVREQLRAHPRPVSPRQASRQPNTVQPSRLQRVVGQQA
jgi:hypothetical protein